LMIEIGVSGEGGHGGGGGGKKRNIMCAVLTRCEKENIYLQMWAAVLCALFALHLL